MRTKLETGSEDRWKDRRARNVTVSDAFVLTPDLINNSTISIRCSSMARIKALFPFYKTCTYTDRYTEVHDTNI